MMMRPSTLLLCAFIGSASLVANASFAQEQCAPQDVGERLSGRRLVRQLALDFMGRVPSMDEWAMLEAGASPEDFVEMFQTSDEYYARLRAQHRALMWGNLDGVGELGIIGTGASRLRDTDLWDRYLGSTGYRMRGGSAIQCLDELQTQFDADGMPIPIRTITGAEAVALGCQDSPITGEPECRQEGYVMVRPFWDMSTELKVCAYAATTITTDINGNSCLQAQNSGRCGCGENLRYCIPTVNSDAQRAITSGLEDEPARIFEGVIREGRSYLEAFTTDDTYVNGATTHYYKYSQISGTSRFHLAVMYDPRMGDLPEMDFHDGWQKVTRDEVHSGFLTTPAYTLRHASNRARINRFYTAFRCEPFLPSSEGIPADTSDEPNPNLRERPGCDSCHTRLEALASAFGRWRNTGRYGYMNEELVKVDTVDEYCVDRCTVAGERCSDFCNETYVSMSNSSPAMVELWGGRPLARAWLSEEEARVIDIGPSSLADEPQEMSRIASCTVRTVAERMLGREAAAEEIAWLEVLTEGFEASGYNYNELVRSVALSETYQAIR